MGVKGDTGKNDADGGQRSFTTADTQKSVRKMERIKKKLNFTTIVYDMCHEVVE